MPIVIAREGPVEPKVAPALTPQQREELWANIVRSWVHRHPDTFAAMVSGGQEAREVAHG